MITLYLDYTHPPLSRRDTNHQPAAAGPLPLESQQPEPILSLLTTSHPLLSSAINGSMSVYTSSKSYSPRFRYGAEFIERNIGSRVANTVGTVGKKTGVEGGIRWALQRRDTPDGKAQSSDQTAASGDNTNLPDVEKGLPASASSTRRSSDISGVESLSPYDMMPPSSYEEFPPTDAKMEQPDSQLLQQQQPGTWPSRLMISTSGLGVAMSEESLRSLTYCLTWLRWANTRLGTSVVSLKQLLEEWDPSKQDQMSADDPNYRPRSPSALSQQIQQVKGDVLQTLKVVVDVVSKYAGGALPENARNLVRRHLTSLPQRFRIASSSNLPADGSIPQSEMATRAHRVLVLAEEGVDMMGQVSVVVNDTLVSAESWCDRLRRPKPTYNTQGREEHDPEQPPLPPRPLEHKSPIPMSNSEDVEMTGVDDGKA